MEGPAPRALPMHPPPPSSPARPHQSGHSQEPGEVPRLEQYDMEGPVLGQSPTCSANSCMQARRYWVQWEGWRVEGWRHSHGMVCVTHGWCNCPYEP